MYKYNRTLYGGEMMIKKLEYSNQNERDFIISAHSHMYLTEELNTKEGNFLVFTDEKPIGFEINYLKHDNTLLKAQNLALSERADFVEDLIAEMAMQVYQ